MTTWCCGYAESNSEYYDEDHPIMEGVTDDGIGDPLDEFIALQIKIVMQGTNSARPPRIKDFRTLALVT